MRDVYVIIPVVASVGVQLEDVGDDTTDEELFTAAVDVIDCSVEDGEFTQWREVEFVQQIVRGNSLNFFGPNSFEVEES